jgi:hypothetical protein
MTLFPKVGPERFPADWCRYITGQRARRCEDRGGDPHRLPHGRNAPSRQKKTTTDATTMALSSAAARRWGNATSPELGRAVVIMLSAAYSGGQALGTGTLRRSIVSQPPIRRGGFPFSE